ncbi:MAG TPA: response regulator [Candidatus Baltobacteraceae bacterium]|nr:response regulator [Candidatus Baltobacteraceae bacterium]
MSRWLSTIRGQVFGVALLPLCFLFLVLLLIAVLRFQTEQVSGAVQRADDAILQSQLVASTLTSMQAHITTYFKTRAVGDLKAAQSDAAQVPLVTARLRADVGDSAPDEKRAVAISGLAADILAIEQRYLDAARRGDRRAALAVLGSPRGRAAVAQWQVQTGALTHAERSLRNERWDLLARNYRVLDWAIALGGLLGIVMSFLAARMLGRRLVRRLERLRRKAHRVASGGELGPAPHGTDELAELERAYHDMASALNQRETQLRKYRLLAEHARDIILFIRRSDGKVIEANAAAAQAYGYSIEELERLNARDLRAPETLGRLDMELDRAEETPLVFETAHRRKNGSTFPVEIAAQSVNIGGERLMVSIVRDITERRLAQQELHAALAQAVDASRSKSEFLATMSHEIRTPLNAVIGMTELLLHSSLAEDQRHCATVAHESGQALLHLINDILDFSKIEARRVELEIVEFRLIPLVEGVAGVFAAQAAQNRVALMTYVNPWIPKLLLGDPGRLRQVLMNLAGNAVKFTHDGSVVITADVLHRDEQSVEIAFCIKDTGIGIAPDAAAKLFEPFRQADGSTTRRYGGTGLGLSISKGLVDLMGGSIALESAPNEGSAFSFNVKLKIAQNQPAEAPNLGEMRGLIIDDDPIARDIFTRYLTSWRMRCEATGDPQQACRMIEAAAKEGDPYDVVLVDLVMPEMDGFELARRVQASADVSHTRLIMVTAYDELERGREAIAAGFSGYLTKPVRQSQLYDCIVNASAPVPAVPARQPVLPDVAGKRILLAEDNAVNREVALRQLGQLGYAAQAVHDGRAAVEAALGGQFDVVLMDCQMPNMDGFEATRAIRKGESRSGKRVRIIAMTANALAEDRQACLDAGMDDYVSKPVTLDALRRVLGGANPPQPLDMGRLRELFEGDERAVDDFLASVLPELLRLVRRVEQTSDVTQCMALAHELKGAAGNVGAIEIAQIATEMEKALRLGAGDVSAFISRLHAAYERAAAVRPVEK